MDTSIGNFDKTKKTVPVTFTVPGKEPFTRDVNAVLDDKGAYDRVSTKARVENEVAPGVQVKFDLGLIGNPAPTVPA